MKREKRNREKTHLQLESTELELRYISLMEENKSFFFPTNLPKRFIHLPNILAPTSFFTIPKTREGGKRRRKSHRRKNQGKEKGRETPNQNPNRRKEITTGKSKR